MSLHANGLFHETCPFPMAPFTPQPDKLTCGLVVSGEVWCGLLEFGGGWWVLVESGQVLWGLVESGGFW